MIKKIKTLVQWQDPKQGDSEGAFHNPPEESEIDTDVIVEWERMVSEGTFVVLEDNLPSDPPKGKRSKSGGD